MIVRRCIFPLVLSVLSAGLAAQAQVDPKLYSDMKWREIGPMRAGRTRALAGVPSEPATFYLGAVNGGAVGIDGRVKRVGARAELFVLLARNDAALN